MIDSNFRGAVWQVIEALDYGDAVSNQVIALDALLRVAGFRTRIYAKHWHPSVAMHCNDLGALSVDETDILVTHFSLYSEHAIPAVLARRCTRILAYHNITPATFFEPGTRLRNLCDQGRQQLADIVGRFHRFWGVSSYNLQELLDLGAPREACSVVPIVVELSAAHAAAARPESERERGAWVFVGRIAPNKAQVKLVQMFARLNAVESAAASRLYLVGGFDEADTYVKAVRRAIDALGLGNRVVLTGKVPDAEVLAYFRRAELFVSMSEHEGFGVPLIEAASHDLPVVALSHCAVPQTLGGSAGLAMDEAELGDAILLLSRDPAARQALLSEQRLNAQRFTPGAVLQNLLGALATIVPPLRHFRSVSVVICTYNRDSLLDRCLHYLQYQTCADFEVIVVNGPSTDGTDEVLRRHAESITVVSNPERNLSKSRNLGLEAARGQLVAYIDDDAIPFDDWIETLLREFNRLPLTFVGMGGPAYYAGSLEFQAQDNGINRFGEAWVNIDPAKVGLDGWQRYPTGTNCCFRADGLRLAGGFDEQFDYYLDESELCFRLQEHGALMFYCADLYLRHEFAQSHNRKGKYDYNWFTICKNTAYFVCAYSGLKGEALEAYLKTNIEDARIQPIQDAAERREVTQAEVDRHAEAIRRGIAQGVRDVAQFPRTREIGGIEGAIKPFSTPLETPFSALHVCIITREFPPFVRGGGVGTLYYHLASELLLMGHRVSVIVPGGADTTYRRGRFSVHYVLGDEAVARSTVEAGFARNLEWSVNALKRLARVHAEWPVDVVDSALWDSESLALAMLPASDRPGLVIRLVTPFGTSVEINGWEVDPRARRYFETAERQLVAAADAVIPISESIALTVEKSHGVVRDARWMRANCGIAYWPFFDVNTGYGDLGGSFGTQLAMARGKKIVLFVGRLEMRKGIDVFLRSIDFIFEREPEAVAVIAGRDVEGWTDRAAEFVRLADRVLFLGEVDDALREKLMSAAYCLVFPSRYESFGIVPLEAFVHGVPVVAAASGAIPEVVIEKQCGLLFPSGDDRALGEAVVRLFRDKNLYAQLKEGARRRVKELSSREAALATVSIYRSVLFRRLAS